MQAACVPSFLITKYLFIFFIEFVEVLEKSAAKMSGPTKLNAIQRMFRFTGLERNMGGVFFSVFAGYWIGTIIDRSTTESLSIFRDRSALYAGKRKEGDPPSWPSREAFWT